MLLSETRMNCCSFTSTKKKSLGSQVKKPPKSRPPHPCCVCPLQSNPRFFYSPSLMAIIQQPSLKTNPECDSPSGGACPLSPLGLVSLHGWQASFGPPLHSIGQVGNSSRKKDQIFPRTSTPRGWGWGWGFDVARRHRGRFVSDQTRPDQTRPAS